MTILNCNIRVCLPYFDVNTTARDQIYYTMMIVVPKYITVKLKNNFFEIPLERILK